MKRKVLTYWWFLFLTSYALFPHISEAGMDCIYINENTVEYTEPSRVTKELEKRKGKRILYGIDPFNKYELALGQKKDGSMFVLIHFFKDSKFVQIDNVSREINKVPFTADTPLELVANVRVKKGPIQFELTYGVQNHFHSGDRIFPPYELRGARFDGRLSVSGKEVGTVEATSFPVVEALGEYFLCESCQHLKDTQYYSQ